MSKSARSSNAKVSVVIPNWNGIADLPPCLDSLLAQSFPAHIMVVENGSTDGSLQLLREQYPMVEVIVHRKNLGFAGGVNSGIRRALERGDEFVALFNNDAVADKDWLKHLVATIAARADAGAVTCKLLEADGKHLDSTGDMYSVWGLPFPRGRNEPAGNQYDTDTEIFGASGGASLYRTALFQDIGLFDEDFFAYYEDIDISFRAQLAGWKVLFAPSALAYHQIGATSRKIKGFTTLQTIKNYPLIIMKDVPGPLLGKIVPRFMLAHLLFCGRAVQRGQFGAVAKGLGRAIALWPKKLHERRIIQKKRTVSTDYIWSILLHDLPPNAHNLRRLRARWHKLTRRKS